MAATPDAPNALSRSELHGLARRVADGETLDSVGNASGLEKRALIRAFAWQYVRDAKDQLSNLDWSDRGWAVVQMRRRYKAGEQTRILADCYGLTIHAVLDAVSGRTWRCVNSIERPAVIRQGRPTPQKEAA